MTLGTSSGESDSIGGLISWTLAYTAQPTEFVILCSQQAIIVRPVVRILLQQGPPHILRFTLPPKFRQNLGCTLISSIQSTAGCLDPPLSCVTWPLGLSIPSCNPSSSRLMAFKSCPASIHIRMTWSNS